MLAGICVALSEGLESLHGTEVFDIGCVHVNLHHGRIVAVVEEIEEAFTGGEEKVTHHFIHLEMEGRRDVGFKGVAARNE